MKLRIALKERAKRRKVGVSSTTSSSTAGGPTREAKDAEEGEEKSRSKVRSGASVSPVPMPVVTAAAAAPVNAAQRLHEMEALRERVTTLQRGNERKRRRATSESPPPPPPMARATASTLRTATAAPPPPGKGKGKGSSSSSRRSSHSRDATTAAIASGLLLWPPDAVAKALDLEPRRPVRILFISNNVITEYFTNLM
jgi:hypothetical protein